MWPSLLVAEKSPSQKSMCVCRCGFRALEEVANHLVTFPELRALVSDEGACVTMAHSHLLVDSSAWPLPVV